MYMHECQKRVRYGETDQMGYLYHGRFADLYEIGRVEMLRSLGMSYRDMEQQQKVMLPVAAMQMRFIRPATYDEMLTIRTTLRSLPDKYMNLHAEIFNEAGKIVNDGVVKLVFVDMNTRKTIYAPEFFLDLVRPYFQEE